MAHRRCSGKPNPPSLSGLVSSSQAYGIAFSLKQSPNEKLPSIRKNVACRVVLPTSSMSGVRTHFCAEVARGNGGVCWPRKNGLNGCMPAFTSSRVGSSAMRLAEGTTVCPCCSK